MDHLEEPLKRGFHVSFGSRAMKGSKILVRQPFHREMMGRIFNILVQVIHLPGVKDTQCGFKLFTHEAVQAIFQRQKMKGFCFDVEVLVLAKRLGFKIKEVPVRWIDSPQSTVNPFKDAIKMFGDLLRLKFRVK
jgi:dolichyl-phosphate beta-glucosyltransferase